MEKDLITEDYVPYGTAQLLKEAGFAVPVRTFYNPKYKGEKVSDGTALINYAEGIMCINSRYTFIKKGKNPKFDTPRKAYAALIDKISGKGTFESNPFVFAYNFNLVK